MYSTIQIKDNTNNKPTYHTVTDIAVYFNISATELNQIFLRLNWAKKEGKWWIATDLGISNGAKQEYDTRHKQKYIKWDSKVKENIELISTVNGFKSLGDIKVNKKMTAKEKKEKGDNYEL